MTRVKNFDFDSDMSKSTFLYPYIYYMASEREQGEEQFHFKKYLLESFVVVVVVVFFVFLL